MLLGEIPIRNRAYFSEIPKDSLDDSDERLERSEKCRDRLLGVRHDMIEMKLSTLAMPLLPLLMDDECCLDDES